MAAVLRSRKQLQTDVADARDEILRIFDGVRSRALTGSALRNRRCGRQSRMRKRMRTRMRTSTRTRMRTRTRTRMRTRTHARTQPGAPKRQCATADS